MQSNEITPNYQNESSAIILPAEVWQGCLKRLEVLEQKINQPLPEMDTYFDIDELAVYVKKKRSTLYGFVHFGKIPVLRAGAKLLFSKKTIDIWIAEGCPNVSEMKLDVDASNYIVNGTISKSRQQQRQKNDKEKVNEKRK